MESNLKKIRQNKGLTQIALALKSGVSHSYIQAIEQGAEVGVSDKIMKKISDALDTPIEEIFLELKREREKLLEKMHKKDSEIWGKLKMKTSDEDEKWLADWQGDYSIYRKRLYELAKKYKIESSPEERQIVQMQFFVTEDKK